MRMFASDMYIGRQPLTPIRSVRSFTIKKARSAKLILQQGRYVLYCHVRRPYDVDLNAALRPTACYDTNFQFYYSLDVLGQGELSSYGP